MFSCGWFFMDVVYFSLWFILSSLDLLSSSFLHVSSNWVFGGSGLWLNISLLRIPFLEVVFWGYPQLLASLSGSMSEISTVNVCIHTKTKLSPEVFCPKKLQWQKNLTSPPKTKQTPVAPTVYPTPRSAIPAPINPRSAPRSSRVHLEELHDVRVALADSWGYSVSTSDWR